MELAPEGVSNVCNEKVDLWGTNSTLVSMRRDGAKARVLFSVRRKKFEKQLCTCRALYSTSTRILSHD